MSAAGRSAAPGLHNQENMLSRLRGAIKARPAANENQENLPPKQAAGRTVLGALQNKQRNQTQNLRGGKQVPRCPACSAAGATLGNPAVAAPSR